MDRRTSNLVVGPIAIFSGLGGPIPLVFQALGLVDQAQAWRDSFVLLASMTWNWAAVYTLAFVFAAVWLISTNVDLGYAAWRRWKNRHQACYDTTMGAAIHYIVERSVFAVGRYTEVMPHEQALLAIIEIASQGKIKIKGMRPHCNQHEIIKRSTFQSAKLEAFRYMEHRERQLSYRLVLRHNNHVVLYDGLLVDMKHVKQVWLPKKLNGGWQSA